MGKSTISMAIFNSYVSHYQRVGFGLTSSVALKPLEVFLAKWPWFASVPCTIWPNAWSPILICQNWCATRCRISWGKVCGGLEWLELEIPQCFEIFLSRRSFPRKSFEQGICPKIAKDQIHDFVAIVVGLPISNVRCTCGGQFGPEVAKKPAWSVL
jgi:hypothetical protein